MSCTLGGQGSQAPESSSSGHVCAGMPETYALWSWGETLKSLESLCGA